MKTVYLNGNFLPAGEAYVSVLDRGFMYGDGIFETIRVYNEVPFRWNDHMERMSGSADALGISHNIDADKLREAVDGLLDKNNFKDAYLRISLSRGIHTGKLSFESSEKPTLVIIADELQLPSREEYANGVSAIIMPQSFVSPVAAHKTLAYLPYLLSREKAMAAGAREALLSGPSGKMTEGTTSNLFIVLENTIFTPPLDGRILPGIARKVTIEALAGEGLKCQEDYFTASDVLDADEIFITNSMAEVLPVTRLDDKAVRDGQVGTFTQKALEVYRNAVSKEVESCGD